MHDYEKEDFANHISKGIAPIDRVWTSMRIGTVNRAEYWNQKTNGHYEHKGVVWSKWTTYLIGREHKHSANIWHPVCFAQKISNKFHFPRNMSVHAGAKQKAVAVKM